MMKRVTWFVTGVAAGATGATYASRKVKERARQLKPTNVARGAAVKAKEGGARFVDAVRDGRAAMQAKEDLRSFVSRTIRRPRETSAIWCEHGQTVESIGVGHADRFTMPVCTDEVQLEVGKTMNVRCEDQVLARRMEVRRP